MTPRIWAVICCSTTASSSELMRHDAPSPRRQVRALFDNLKAELRVQSWLPILEKEELLHREPYENDSLFTPIFSSEDTVPLLALPCPNVPMKTAVLSQLDSLNKATGCLWGLSEEEAEFKQWEIQATQGTRKCFCPKNIPSRQSLSTDWFGSQKELVLMMEMFSVAIFLLSLFYISILS